MQITSPAFKNNELIPPEYTCDGRNVNPELMFYAVPVEAESLALIVTDPDAPSGVFTHWLVWNIDPSTVMVKENDIIEGASEGVNDFGNVGYGGPCPPVATHRYFFKLYALNSKVNPGIGVKREELDKAIMDKIIDSAELIGKYARIPTKIQPTANDEAVSRGD